jgi:hypothetical protein
MKNIITVGSALAMGLAFMLALPASDASASGRMKCAKRETVATGSSIIHRMLAKSDAEVAWELKVVEQYGPLWYSWWASENHRFTCRQRGRRTICVARGRPCRLL